jgi:hypothetical protein
MKVSPFLAADAGNVWAVAVATPKRGIANSHGNR